MWDKAVMVLTHSWRASKSSETVRVYTMNRALFTPFHEYSQTHMQKYLDTARKGRILRL